MAAASVGAGIKSAEISAVVTRADGTTINLGKVSSTNPVLNAYYRIRLYLNIKIRMLMFGHL
jgi:hypothetical protein